MNLLKLLYNTAPGRFILKGLTHPCVSAVAGMFMDSSLSTALIHGFIKRNNIPMDDYEDAFYDSFNEFFCRRIKAEKRPLDMNPQHFIAPCDGLLSVYKVTNGLVIPVKQSSYSIARLLRSRKLARKYEGGMCLVFRLCVDNYHRYCFPDNAVTGRPRHIRGILHTVRPVALYKEPVFTENTREYTLLRTENFGDIVQMEVGAMLIGKIDNYNTDRNVKRGAEKGRFLYGGSTIIVLLEKDAVSVPENLLKATQNEIEIPVKMGQMICEKK
jgi:phosphatidylserine decarboxylase